MAAIPLYLDKEVVGIMTLASSEPAAFDQCAPSVNLVSAMLEDVSACTCMLPGGVQVS